MNKKAKYKFLKKLLIIIVVLCYYYINNNQESFSKKEEQKIEEKEYVKVWTDLRIHFIDVGQADSILIKNKEYSM